MNSTKCNFKTGDIVFCVKTKQILKIQNSNFNDDAGIRWVTVSLPQAKLKTLNRYVRYTDDTDSLAYDYLKCTEELVYASKLAKLLYSEGDCL